MNIRLIYALPSMHLLHLLWIDWRRSMGVGCIRGQWGWGEWGWGSGASFIPIIHRENQQRQLQSGTESKSLDQNPMTLDGGLKGSTAHHTACTIIKPHIKDSSRPSHRSPVSMGNSGRKCPGRLREKIDHILAKS